MKRAFALVILVLVAVAGLASVAQAHKKKYKVDFSPTEREFVLGVGYKYSGSVLSSQSKCTSNRIVDVRIGPLGESHLVDSDGDGNWVVPNSTATPPNEYQVDILTDSKPIKSNPEHKHVCKAGHGIATFPGITPP